MICSKCGTEFPDESEFCWKCGTKVVKDDYIFCWKCGSKLPADCEFCNRCGTKQRNGVPSPSNETVNAAASSVNTYAAPEDTTESSEQPRQENAADTPEPNDIPDGGESDTRSPDDLTGIEFMCMTKAEIKRLQGKQAGIAEMSEYLSRLVLEEGALIHKNLRVGDSLDKASAVFNTYLNRCVSYCGNEATATFYYDTDQRRIMLEFKLDRDFKILQAVLTGEKPVKSNQQHKENNDDLVKKKVPKAVKIILIVSGIILLVCISAVLTYDPIKSIKEGHFVEVDSVTVGEMLDYVYDNHEWYAKSVDGKTIVYCEGDLFGKNVCIPLVKVDGDVRYLGDIMEVNGKVISQAEAEAIISSIFTYYKAMHIRTH